MRWLKYTPQRASLFGPNLLLIRGKVMKQISVFVVFLFFSLSARAQQTTSGLPVQVAAAASSEDARMKALEDQVSTLASEVSLLRTELQPLRGASSNTPQNAEP